MTGRGHLLFAVLAVAALVAAPGAAFGQEGGGEPRPATPAARIAQAVVTDEFEEIFKVEEPVFFMPPSGFSLGGGGKGTKLKELHVWKGAHEVQVPIDRIVEVRVGQPAGSDLIHVTVYLAGGLKLEGKVERELELRGRVQYGSYQIKVERAKSIRIHGA